ncbi:dolichol-phosphate mannosyltransferase subunit 3 isoform X1 [Colletes gigas]|uniref:dolichol-phosphate mannosyltransferase subunit 3 isoform X1 n=2 Tax=Colletes gigas TaxID=935657 RepID=UPI001C9B1893|nr:dolichol-phosphate mannosyltransferase subunit 3 isoform X1 [Colletes gigas]
MMTKLMEWFLFATLFFGVWVAMITGNINSSAVELQQVILFLPFIVLFLFSLYAAIIVLYRVFTFNNCENAAIELQQQIKEAKRDLQSKGVDLKDKTA